MAGLDANIFFQRAALENANAANLQSQIGSGLAQYSKRKDREAELKAKGLDLDPLLTSAAVKYASGQELTPEEMTAVKASAILSPDKTMFDPTTGEMIRTPSGAGNLLSVLGGAQGSYKPTYTRPQPVVSGGEADSPFPANFQNGSPAEIPTDGAQFPQMTVDQIDASLPRGLQADALAPQNINQPRPIQDTTADAMMANSGLMGTPKGNAAQYNAGLDIKKDAIKDAATEEAAIRKEQREKLDPSKYNENQAKAANYAKRAVYASSLFDALPTGADKAKTNTTAMVAGAVLPDSLADLVVKAKANPDQQQYLNAAQEWIRAKLRLESGAVIGADEMAKDYDTYFPTALDTPQVIKQKALLRKNVEKGLIEESGGLYDLQNKKEPGGFKYLGVEK